MKLDRLEFILYEIAELGLQDSKQITQASSYGKLNYLNYLFNMLKKDNDCPQDIACALFVELSKLTSQEAKKQTKYPGVKRLNDAQTDILNKLMEQVANIPPQTFTDVDMYMDNPRTKISIIESLLHYVVNHSLKVDEGNNRKKLQALYKKYFMLDEKKPIENTEQDNENEATEQENKNEVAEHGNLFIEKLINIIEGDKAFLNTSEQVNLKQSCADIQKLMENIHTTIFSNPPCNTNLRVERLVVQMEDSFSTLQKKLASMYARAPITNNDMDNMLCQISRLLREVKWVFVRRYDPTKQLREQQKVRLAATNVNATPLRPVDRLWESNIVQTPVTVPKATSMNKIKTQAAELTYGKTSSFLPKVHVSDYVFDRGLNQNTIADIMITAMQSYDQTDKHREDERPLVAAHFSAVATVSENNMVRHYVVSANKGRYAASQDAQTSAATRADTMQRPLDEDGGRTFVVSFEHGHLTQFKVELASLPYHGDYNIPDVHVKQLFKKPDTTYFVLTVNDTVVKRMNHLDIEHYLNEQYLSNPIKPTEQSIAEQIRHEAYRRYHKSEYDEASGEPFDRGSKNIAVAVAKVSFEPGHVYINRVVNFPEGVRPSYRLEGDILAASEQLNALLPKNRAVTLRDINNPFAGKEIQLTEVPIDDPPTDSASDQQDVAAYRLGKLDEIISLAGQLNKEALANALIKFKDLVQHSIAKKKHTFNLWEAVYNAVYFSFEAKKSDTVDEMRINLRNAKESVQHLNNLTEVHNKYERVLGVIVSILVGLVVGTLLAVILAATGVMPAAIVAAITVAGWVATIGVPLAVAGGVLSIYGIFGTRYERARRATNTMLKECVQIGDEVKKVIEDPTSLTQ